RKSVHASSVMGPLRVNPANPRYFTDGSGKAVYLTGAHTWNNRVDIGPANPPAMFNFTTYLDFLQSHNHNFIRLWAQNLTKVSSAQCFFQTDYVTPSPWARTGGGVAEDGYAKFDLSQLYQPYFDRLAQRVSAARDRGIYVSIMLFEGF